ncbi:MAG: F0F1 ATP synthase subunit A [Myxococcota bacterium]
MIASGFSWFNIIPPLDQNALGSVGGADYNVTITMAHAWLACFGVLAFAVLGRMAIARASSRQGMEKYFADERFSIRTIVELFGTFVRNMMGDVMPKHEVRHYSAYIATLFLYILFCNLQGVFPGLLPPTDNVNTNVGMALASFAVFMWVGLSRDPVGFIKHLMGPMLPLAVLMFPLETLSLVLRPMTLALRLTGNLFGDHLVFTIISGEVPLLVPSALLGLAIFVSFMQAFVFSLLSAVYVGLSLPHDHHDHDDHHEAH